MKNYKIFGLGWLLFFSISSCKETKGPTISYTNNVVDLGSIVIKKDYNGEIILSNTGDQPLKLLGATSDCSCTVPDNIKNTIIDPKHSGKVKFKLTPGVDGYLQQSIFIDNNSINESRVLFLIRANVKME